jgi:hypothetical protein
MAREVDRVIGFQNGIDRLVIDGVTGKTPQAMYAALGKKMVSFGGDQMLQITYAGHRILVDDMTLAQLGVSDFIFI